MRSRIRLTALAVVFALLLVPQTLLAQGLERVTPEEVGMSSERLDRLSLALESYVDEGRLAGAVTIVVRKGKIAYREGIGYRDVEGPGADAVRRHLPDRLADEGARQRRRHAAAGGGQAADHRPGRQVPPRVRRDDRRRAERRGRLRRGAGAPADHHPRPADPYRRHQLRHGPARQPRTGRRRVGGGGDHRLVLRRPRRDRGRDHGAPGRVADGRAPRRALDLRLQHRHPGRDDRGDQRPDARGVPEGTAVRPARDDRYALLPARGQAGPAGHGLFVGRRREQLRAGARPGPHGRPGTLRERPAQGVLGGRGGAVDRHRLRHVPADDAERRRAQRHPHPVAQDGGVDDLGSHGRHPVP